jgi:hypothetical protein
VRQLGVFEREDASFSDLIDRAHASVLEGRRIFLEQNFARWRAKSDFGGRPLPSTSDADRLGAW